MHERLKEAIGADRTQEVRSESLAPSFRKPRRGLPLGAFFRFWDETQVKTTVLGLGLEVGPRSKSAASTVLLPMRRRAEVGKRVCRFSISPVRRLLQKLLTERTWP
jgi:hypothetical protein